MKQWAELPLWMFLIALYFQCVCDEKSSGRLSDIPHITRGVMKLFFIKTLVLLYEEVSCSERSSEEYPDTCAEVFLELRGSVRWKCEEQEEPVINSCIHFIQSIIQSVWVYSREIGLKYELLFYSNNESWHENLQYCVVVNHSRRTFSRSFIICFVH